MYCLHRGQSLVVDVCVFGASLYFAQGDETGDTLFIEERESMCRARV